MDAGEARVEATLLVHPDDTGASSPGDRIRLGVLFDLDPGWHIYWRNPGDTGLPTELAWTVEGADVGGVAWPAPHAFHDPIDGLTSYGYEHQVLLVSEALVSSAAAGPRGVHVAVEGLVCATMCIPASFELSDSIPSAEPAESARAEIAALFARFAEKLPSLPREMGVELEALYSQSAIRPEDAFSAAIATTSCRGGGAGACQPFSPAPGPVAFFPELVDAVELRPTGPLRHPEDETVFLATLEGQALADDPGADQRLRGVLPLQAADGSLRHVLVDLPLPRARPDAQVALFEAQHWFERLAGEANDTSTGLNGLLQAVLLAALGGLILNLMPCVLPVLAIKVFAVAEMAHRSRRELALHGLAYLAGIELSMLILASAVALLRSAGRSVGWGFQFQEPVFLLAISTVLVVFALNLFGVFEISFSGGRLTDVGRDATGARRSFFEGLLAVVLSTPCSAPFLGTAVGFAFASPAPVIAAVFAATGLGLATPFVLVSLVPAASRWIPRSGAWMLKLRAGLGFVLLLTVVWLLQVAGRSVGVDGVAGILAFLLAVAALTWVFESAQAASPGRMSAAAGLGLVVLLVAGHIALPLTVTREACEGEVDAGDRAWRPFAPAELGAELASGRTAFVYFTADWCLTCKVNEKRVLARAEVREELERLDVAVFRADWTLRDDAIRAELARHGRAGVPLYLVYDPDAPQKPRLLSEILTVDELLKAVRAAGEPT